MSRLSKKGVYGPLYYAAIYFFHVMSHVSLRPMQYLEELKVFEHHSARVLLLPLESAYCVVVTTVD